MVSLGHNEYHIIVTMLWIMILGSWSTTIVKLNITSKKINKRLIMSYQGLTTSCKILLSLNLCCPNHKWKPEVSDTINRLGNFQAAPQAILSPVICCYPGNLGNSVVKHCIYFKYIFAFFLVIIGLGHFDLHHILHFHVYWTDLSKVLCF